jgi:HPt (histidine-containing phosphotransfer) domain-containing protein
LAIVVNTPLATTHAPDDTGHPALLDSSILNGLLASLNHDETALDAFLAAFIHHWPERLHRIDESAAAGDRAALHDCALSVKVSSQMVGAARLSACGSDLENLVRSDRLDGVPAALEILRAVGEATVSALAGIRKHGLAA